MKETWDKKNAPSIVEKPPRATPANHEILKILDFPSPHQPQHHALHAKAPPPHPTRHAFKILPARPISPFSQNSKIPRRQPVEMEDSTSIRTFAEGLLLKPLGRMLLRTNEKITTNWTKGRNRR
jgi:hypothetical protein